MFIYLITNTITGKNYVGQTKRSLDQRFKSHLYEAEKMKYNMYLHNSIRKYGKDNFSIQLLEECASDISSDRERFWIKHLNTKEPFGYNEHDGGNGGCLNASPELRKKLSDAKKGKSPWNKGLNKSDPRVAKNAEGISRGNKGKPKSDSHKKSMSAAHRKRRGASLTEGTPKTSE